MRSASCCNLIAGAGWTPLPEHGARRGDTVHIPDRYLSPRNWLVGFAVAAPVAAVAVRKVKRVVKTRHTPTLALFAALAFVVMMFNIPIPDGTTAHAVGGGVIAIILGP